MRKAFYRNSKRRDEKTISRIVVLLSRLSRSALNAHGMYIMPVEKKMGAKKVHLGWRGTSDITEATDEQCRGNYCGIEGVVTGKLSEALIFRIPKGSLTDNGWRKRMSDEKNRAMSAYLGGGVGVSRVHDDGDSTMADGAIPKTGV